MKKQFKEFYKDSNDSITSENIKDDNILICFDANVLLNVYRYSDEVRTVLFNSLEEIQSKIYVPYNAAREFNLNKNYVLDDVLKQEQNMKEKFNLKFNQLAREISEDILDHENKMKCIDDKILTDQLKENLTRNLDNFKDNWIENELQKKFNSYKELNSANNIDDKLATILDGYVGEPYDKNKISEIEREGKLRYEKGVPPGYYNMDETGTDSYYLGYEFISFKKKYNDLIIWNQIIDEANKNHKINKILFVTDDSVGNWTFRINGKSCGMRPELRKEFLERTKKYMEIVDTNTFLQLVLDKDKSYIDEKSTVKLVQNNSNNDIQPLDTPSISMEEVMNLNESSKNLESEVNKFYTSFKVINDSALSSRTFIEKDKLERFIYDINTFENELDSLIKDFTELRSKGLEDENIEDRFDYIRATLIDVLDMIEEHR